MATTALISDIGGTNARFELLEISAEAGTRVIDQKVLSTRDFQSLEVCISTFLAGRPACSICVIAIAGLIDNHKQWSGSYLWPSSSEQQLQKLGFGSVVFLNDLEAAGLGATKLTSEQVTNINPQASAVPFSPKVVISHGTGFGFSFVTAHDQLYTPWHSETGSSAFGPKGPLQTEYVRFLL